MFPGGTDEITNTAIMIAGSGPGYELGTSLLQVRSARAWAHVLVVTSL